MVEIHRLTSNYRNDAGLEPCKFCGSTMLGKRVSRYGRDAYNFSCSNRNCVLHRSRNVLTIPVFAKVVGSDVKITESEAIDVVNGDLELEPIDKR